MGNVLPRNLAGRPRRGGRIQPRQSYSAAPVSLSREVRSDSRTSRDALIIGWRPVRRRTLEYKINGPSGEIPVAVSFLGQAIHALNPVRFDFRSPSGTLSNATRTAAPQLVPLCSPAAPGHNMQPVPRSRGPEPLPQTSKDLRDGHRTPGSP